MIIDVYQGEEYYADNHIHLGEIKVGVPLAPKGKETITVCYTYDINGILIVDVEIDSTGEKRRQVFSTGKKSERDWMMHWYRMMNRARI